MGSCTHSVPGLAATGSFKVVASRPTTYVPSSGVSMSHQSILRQRWVLNRGHEQQL